MCICACVYECVASVCVGAHVNEHVRVSTQCLPASSFPQAPSTGRCCHQHGRAGPLPSLLHLSQAVLSLAPGSCPCPLEPPPRPSREKALQEHGPSVQEQDAPPFSPAWPQLGRSLCARACVPLCTGTHAPQGRPFQSTRPPSAGRTRAEPGSPLEGGTDISKRLRPAEETLMHP